MVMYVNINCKLFLHLFLIIFLPCCIATFMYIFVALQHFLYFCALQHFFAPFIFVIVIGSFTSLENENYNDFHGGRGKRGPRSSANNEVCGAPGSQTLGDLSFPLSLPFPLIFALPFLDSPSRNTP